MEGEGRHLDIWMPGTLLIFLHLILYVCIADWTNDQVFEIITGRELFRYEAYKQHGLGAPAGHFWQMMCFTGERSTAEQLMAGTYADRYFDITCSSFFSVCPFVSF